MNIEELEEELCNIFQAQFQIRKGKNNKIVIYTSLIENDDGELEDADSDDDFSDDLEGLDDESLDMLEEDEDE